MIIIDKKELRQTCHFCPSSWVGKTKESKDVYIRFRWGHFTLEVNDEIVFEDTDFDPLDGVINESDMIELVNSKSKKCMIV